MQPTYKQTVWQTNEQTYRLTSLLFGSNIFNMFCGVGTGEKAVERKCAKRSV